MKISIPVVTVGGANADFPGYANVAIQGAVDYAASMGGGRVALDAGVFDMRDALHMRSYVDIAGQGDGTVLLKAPSKTSKTVYYLGFGHYDVSVAEPDLFSVGEGVLIEDDYAAGFYATQSTVTGKRDNILGIRHPLNADIHSDKGGAVTTVYPLIRGESACNFSVSDLKIDGNAGMNAHCNGCRGGGVFMLGCENYSLKNLTVTNFNGEGISFQQCKNISIQGCRCYGNTGNGCHPGSGSVNVLIEDCDFSGNGNNGVFYCLRVAHSIFRRNIVCDNAYHGVSIGHRDFYIGIEDCRFTGNLKSGVAFRNDNIPNGTGNYTYILRCLFDNARGTACDGTDAAEIDIPQSATGIEIGHCEFKSPHAPIAANHRMTDCHAYENKYAAPALIRENSSGGFALSPPSNPFRVDFAKTPAEDFLHLRR